MKIDIFYLSIFALRETVLRFAHLMDHCDVKFKPNVSKLIDLDVLDLRLLFVFFVSDVDK